MIKTEENKTFSFSDLKSDATLILKEIIDLTLEKECSFELKKDQNLNVVNLFLDLKNLEFILDRDKSNLSPWVNPRFNNSGLIKIGRIDYNLFYFKTIDNDLIELSINKNSLKAFLWLNILDESSDILNNFIYELKKINNDTTGSSKSYFFKTEDLIFTNYFVLEFKKLLENNFYNPIANYFFKGLYKLGFSKNSGIFPDKNLENLLNYSYFYLNKSEFLEFQKNSICYFKTFDLSDGVIPELIREHLINGLDENNSIKSISELFNLLELKKLNPTMLDSFYLNLSDDDLKFLSKMIVSKKILFDNSGSFNFFCLNYSHKSKFYGIKIKSEVDRFISMLDVINSKILVNIHIPTDLNEEEEDSIIDLIQPLIDHKHCKAEIIYFDVF